MSQSEQNILLVDGMALLFRAFYATSSNGYIMRTSAGTPTNAVYGFVKYFMDAVKTFEPSHIICCWDMGGQTFRTEKFPDYKANRSEAPEELLPQFDLVKEVVESFNVPNLGFAGYEADDCIGTLASLFKQEARVQILTGDHDMLQLVDEQVHVIIMKKGQSNYAVYTPEFLLEDKKLAPKQIVDFKGLMGDASDNYPGVKGIGEKTALKLIHEYHSIEGVLANLPSLAKGVRAKIEAGLDMLHLSRELASIRCDVPISCTLEECRWQMDRVKAIEMFEKLEFKGLMKMIG